MPWNRYVIAYHGCDARLAQQIVTKKKTLLPSKNKYDWLGHGLYFWEDSVERARHWVRHEARSKVAQPAVIGAVIDLGNCLNLMEKEALSLVEENYHRYISLCERQNQPLARNSGTDFKARYLDCAVFEILHTLRESEEKTPFDTVRGFFVEGKPLYENAGIRTLDHVQVCVRNPAMILGYFHPLHAPDA